MISPDFGIIRRLMANGEGRVVVQTPAWALWLLAFFATIATAGGSAWLSNVNTTVQLNVEMINVLKTQQAVVSNELVHMHNQLDEMQAKLTLALSELAVIKIEARQKAGRVERSRDGKK